MLRVLLSEMELLALSPEEGGAVNGPAVKFLGAPEPKKKGETGPLGEGPGKGPPEKPCKFWGSDEGCRAAQVQI